MSGELRSLLLSCLIVLCLCAPGAALSFEGEEPGPGNQAVVEGSGSAAEAPFEPRRPFRFYWSDLIEPAGIATLVLLMLTGLAGLLRKRSPGFLLKWHKRLAVSTMVAALVHATLVLVL